MLPVLYAKPSAQPTVIQMPDCMFLRFNHTVTAFFMVHGHYDASAVT